MMTPPIAVVRLVAMETPDARAAEHLPSTITEVLEARLDRLPEAATRVVRPAAVIGRTFWYRVLARLLPEGSVSDGLGGVSTSQVSFTIDLEGRRALVTGAGQGVEVGRFDLAAEQRRLEMVADIHIAAVEALALGYLNGRYTDLDEMVDVLVLMTHGTRLVRKLTEAGPAS